jgi:asparagine synthase (glutamine-hydrolysing)
MCGICGVISADPGEVIHSQMVIAMRETLHHREPDQAGLYIGPGVGLGHRRLSIIDLRTEGRQPMANEDGHIFTMFKGEIYNYESLRQELLARGHVFRSKTDSR